MILVADSGSTKTNWCFSSGKDNFEFYSSGGINPYFRTTEDIIQELRKALLPTLTGKVQRIFFYGAGVVNKEKADVIKSALSQLFPGAYCEVESDLLAAARSTLGHKPGIACILGTGSNSCFYDGDKISAHVPPLGYILGDEGSGTYLGRRLLADYLKGIIPEELSGRFREMFPQDYSEFLSNVYQNENVRMFLASFVPFLKENINDEYCLNLVACSFEDFIRRNVNCYANFNKYHVSFIGSVAFYFQEQLKAALTKQNLLAGVILKEPLEKLIQYHLE